MKSYTQYSSELKVKKNRKKETKHLGLS